MHEKVLADKTLFFDRPFTQRIKEGCDSFSQGEEKLREMIRNKAASDDITDHCCKLLSPAFSDVCFEVGFNGEKYDLILTPEKNKFMLFFLDAFKKQAPESILKNWNVILGRPACGNQILGFHGEKISPADVYVKIEKDENSGECHAVGYSKKLLHVLKRDRNEALWFFDLLLDMALGEMVNMRYIDTIDMTDKPFEKKDNAVPLMDLSLEMKKSYGDREGWDTAEGYLESCVGYQMKPDEESENFIPRHDIYVGFSSFSPIIDCYYNKDKHFTEQARNNGAVSGFIFYPLWDFEEDGENKKSDKVLDFRDELEAYINQKTNNSAFCFLGGATGVFFGYLDFIAWDLKAVLTAAEEFFADKNFIPYACFQAFDEESD
ncbi:MAG: hypothetical protein K2K41_06895, partial [Ruminiclostridium sp.]|nr:hypothetical protein [Ruminiclostridium sp.]